MAPCLVEDGSGGACYPEAAPSFFYGDVVEWRAMPGLLGTVVQHADCKDPNCNDSGGDDMMYSSDDGVDTGPDDPDNDDVMHSSCSDDDDVDGADVAVACEVAHPDEQQRTGLVRSEYVLWLDAPAPAIVPGAELRLVDRPFRHGSLVRWIRSAAVDYPGPVGQVAEVRVTVDLRMQDDGTLVTGVDTRELGKVREFQLGDAVVQGAWVGRVVDLQEHVTVELDADGAVCTLEDAGPATLVRPGSEGFPYHPGQSVVVASPAALRAALWAPGSRAMASRHRVVPAAATVVGVTQGTVYVDWTHSCDVEAAAGAGPPSEQQDPRGLTPLTHFRYADWTLGDAGVVARGACPALGRCARVVRVRTEVDVAWQAGGVAWDVPAYVLESVDPPPPPQRRGLWPGNLVTERRPGGGGRHGAWRRTGVVQRVDAARRAVAVRWLDLWTGRAGGAEEETTLGMDDVVAEQGDAMGAVGDLVVRVRSPCPIIVPTGTGRRRSGAPPEVPWVGLLRESCVDGTVEVVWSDGSASRVTRSQVRVVP